MKDHRRSSIFDHHHQSSTSTCGNDLLAGTHRLSRNMAIVGPASRSSARGVDQFVARTEQLVGQAKGARDIDTESCEYGSNVTCRHRRIGFAFCVACAPGPPGSNRTRIMRTACAGNKAIALLLAQAPPLWSCAVTPRRRGAAVRQHEKRGHARQSR